LDTSSVSLLTYFPASISEANGNLVFYSGLGEVYNGNHDIVPSNSVIPYNPSIQRGLIIRKPQSNQYYYIYSKYETPPRVNSGVISFALYDPSLNNNNGDLISNSHQSLPGRYQDVYEKKHRWNSGHLAIQHMAKTYQKINMWGMDSMFTDDLTSQMDDRVSRPRRPNLNIQWRPNWTTVFKQAPNTEFVVHIPKGATGIDYAENCVYKHH
jgi:hypothetical protein